MELDEGLRIIHEPARLRILALLHRHGDVGFLALRDTLRLTDGNLATHARRLEAAGYVQIRRELLRQGFALRMRITEQGADAFARYLAALQGFLDDAGAIRAGHDRSANTAVGDASAAHGADEGARGSH